MKYRSNPKMTLLYWFGKKSTLYVPFIVRSQKFLFKIWPPLPSALYRTVPVVFIQDLVPYHRSLFVLSWKCLLKITIGQVLEISRHAKQGQSASCDQCVSRPYNELDSYSFSHWSHSHIVFVSSVCWTVSFGQTLAFKCTGICLLAFFISISAILFNLSCWSSILNLIFYNCVRVHYKLLIFHFRMWISLVWDLVLRNIIPTYTTS